MDNYIQKAIKNAQMILSGLTRKLFRSNQVNFQSDNPATEQLRSTLADTKERAEQAQATLGKIGARLQTVIDHADATLPLVTYINPSNLEEINIIWDEVSKQTQHTYDWLEDAFSSTGTVSGTVSLTSATTSGILSTRIVPYSGDPAFRDAWNRYAEVSSRPTVKAEVVSFLKSFGLDVLAPSKNSSLDLFQTAHQAYETPISQSNPVITSLIPMREAVETAIDELLRYRPQQEATGSSYRAKIKSIGSQLCKDMISDVVVQEWADQWHDISDKDLSASKRYRMTREEWSRRLNRATLLFHSFLSGLDPNKFRK